MVKKCALDNINDVVIIGAGVIGSLIARELSRYNLNIVIVDKCDDVSMGASSANSGIVHAGFDAAPGTLKAKYNVIGNKLMPMLAKQLGVPFKNNGSMVIGFSDEDLTTLNGLVEKGDKNGVHTSIINADQIKALEPNISSNATCALYAESGAIISPYKLTIAAIGNAIDNGVTLKLNFAVNSLIDNDEYITVTSSNNISIKARLIINCAGIFADKIANMLNDYSFKIGARKGEYILTDSDQAEYFKSTIFMCPSASGKGVLITPTADGNLLLGPTAALSTDIEDNSISADGIDFIRKNALKISENAPLNSVITSFCGIRAYSDRNDFVIEKSLVNNKLINVAGIESPGLTASPAIAVEVANMVTSILQNVKINAKFNANRTPFDHFKRLSIAEKNKLIAREPAYGKIICRCEEITLGEILHSIKMQPTPNNLDAIKRRTRAGMGRCQGGFCQMSVLDELAKLNDVDFMSLTKNGGNSYLFTGRTK